MNTQPLVDIWQEKPFPVQRALRLIYPESLGMSPKDIALEIDESLWTELLFDDTNRRFMGTRVSYWLRNPFLVRS